MLLQLTVLALQLHFQTLQADNLKIPFLHSIIVYYPNILHLLSLDLQLAQGLLEQPF